MKRFVSIVVAVMVIMPLTGCVKTYEYKVERKDQALVGNRGIIMGEVPPDEPDRRRQRTMTGVDIILPSSKEYKAKKRTISMQTEPAEKDKVLEEFYEEEESIPYEVSEEEVEPVERVQEVRPVVTSPARGQTKKAAPRVITYTVMKGDTLEKIAKRFLGKSSLWVKIYEANRGVIKDPSKIYPGQVIAIPPSEVVKESPTDDIK